MDDQHEDRTGSDDRGGDDDREDRREQDGESIPGDVREDAPYNDAPAEGKFAPDADNPPP